MRAQSRITIIELSAVILTVAAALFLLIPAMGHARGKSKSMICMMNLRILSHGWLEYAEDNDDIICGGTTGNTGDPMNCWVDFPDGNAPDERLEKQRAIKDGVLYPYIGTVQAYHCPSDIRYLSSSKSSRPYGLELGGYRSYSIAGGMRGVSPEGAWQIIPIQKLSELKRPGSRYIYVTEADGRGANIGSWVLNPKTHEWVDPLALFHNNTSNLGFADGHAETHKWIDQSTFDAYKNQMFYPQVYPTDTGDDLAFMVQAYPYKQLQ